MTITFATPEDLATLSATSPSFAKRMGRKSSRGEIVVARVDDTPIGYLILEYLWGSLPFIALLRVFPEHQRQGIGTALITFTAETLRTDGHDTLYSSSQADESEPQAWHRHVGFEECGFLAGVNENGIGEIFFRKRL